MALDVLIIDDDTALATVFKLTLETQGYTVEFVTGRESALAYLKSNEIPKLVFLDASLPQVTGGELAVDIKAVAPNCKLVGLSGHAPGSDVISDFEKAVDVYFQKPNDLESLIQIIKNLI